MICFRIIEFPVLEKPQKLPGGIEVLELLPSHSFERSLLGSYHGQEAQLLPLTQLMCDFRQNVHTDCVGTAISFTDWNDHTSCASYLVEI